VDDRLGWVSVGEEAGTVTTAVCVKTWPSDVWMMKEMLEVKDGLEEEEEEEEVLVGVGDEDVAPAELDAAALEGVLEDVAGVLELDGVAVVCGVVVGTAWEEGVGVGLVVGLGSGVVAGVDTGA